MVSSFSPQYSAAAEGEWPPPIRVDEAAFGGANPSGYPSLNPSPNPSVNPSAEGHQSRYPMTGEEVVKFKTVRSINAMRPSILAIVDGHRVSWEQPGWDCTCDAPENAVCNHIKAALSYLDPGVFILATRRAVINGSA